VRVACAGIPRRRQAAPRRPARRQPICGATVSACDIEIAPEPARPWVYRQVHDSDHTFPERDGVRRSDTRRSRLLTFLHVSARTCRNAVPRLPAPARERTHAGSRARRKTTRPEQDISTRSRIGSAHPGRYSKVTKNHLSDPDVSEGTSSNEFNKPS
jgi:hypothetical protein